MVCVFQALISHLSLSLTNALAKLSQGNSLSLQPQLQGEDYSTVTKNMNSESRLPGFRYQLSLAHCVTLGKISKLSGLQCCLLYSAANAEVF